MFPGLRTFMRDAAERSKLARVLFESECLRILPVRVAALSTGRSVSQIPVSEELTCSELPEIRASPADSDAKRRRAARRDSHRRHLC